MSLANDAADLAVTALAAATGAAVREFLNREPDVAQKAKGGVELLKQALEMIPDEELSKFLTYEDEASAELAFKLGKIAKLTAMRK